MRLAFTARNAGHGCTGASQGLSVKADNHSPADTSEPLLSPAAEDALTTTGALCFLSAWLLRGEARGCGAILAERRAAVPAQIGDLADKADIATESGYYSLVCRGGGGLPLRVRCHSGLDFGFARPRRAGALPRSHPQNSPSYSKTRNR